MNDGKSGQVFTAFALGIGIGAAFGILFAPRSGEETRDSILRGARERLDDAMSTGRDYVQRAREGVEQVKGQVRDKVESGKDYARRAQETIGQVKDQASDQVRSKVANAADSVDRAYHQAADTADSVDRAYHRVKGA